MVKINIPLLSFKAIGKLGGFTYLRRRRIDIVEKTPVVPDARSEGQLSWRTMYQKCAALWHLLSAAEKAVWESQARPRHMTGFAWFQSQCLRPNPGIYLPLQGGTMAGDIDMAGHKIEDLPDPAANQEAATKAYHDANLPVGGYTEGAKALSSNDLTIPNTTWTQLSFNSEFYDTDNIHDPVTTPSLLVCRTAGIYLITSFLHFEFNPTGRRQQAIVHSVDGVLIYSPETTDPIGETPILLTCVHPMAVGEDVRTRVYQNSGGNLKVLSLGIYTPTFIMQRIG